MTAAYENSTHGTLPTLWQPGVHKVVARTVRQAAPIT